MLILKENDYSEPISNKFLGTGNLEHLYDLEAGQSDSVIKIKPAGSESFRFKIHNHCGYLTVGGNSYFILPKAGESFLRTMLGSFPMPRFSLYEGDLNLVETRRMFDEFIANMFVGLYERHIGGNLRFGYHKVTQANMFGSGRININESKTFLTSGLGLPHWDKFLWSRNTKLNKSLRTLFRNLVGILSVSNKTKASLVEISDSLAEQDYVGHIDFKEISYNLDRLHDHYRPIVDLAANFNFCSGVASGKISSNSLLIPTWQLFEGACRAELTREMPNVIVNADQSFTRRVSRDCRNYLDPDIVVRNKLGADVAAGDCKYVENPRCQLNRDHLFQVNTYMDGYYVPWTFILYPGQKFEIREFELTWGKSVAVFNLPTNNSGEFKSAILSLSEYISKRIAIPQMA